MWTTNHNLTLPCVQGRETGNKQTITTKCQLFILRNPFIFLLSPSGATSPAARAGSTYWAAPDRRAICSDMTDTRAPAHSLPYANHRPAPFVNGRNKWRRRRAIPLRDKTQPPYFQTIKEKPLFSRSVDCQTRKGKKGWDLGWGPADGEVRADYVSV